MSDQTQPPIVTLKENRFPLFSLVLVILAFCLTAYVVFLNYEMTKVTGAQLLRAQQMQERAQAKFLDQYSTFLFQQAQSARFERTFEVRQKHYSDFMGALSDAWGSVGRKDGKGLENALHQLAKSYYALEPFLDAGSRHYMQKRIAIFHNLAKQLMGYEQERRGIIMEDKTTMDRMIQDFQEFLYPLLFEPLDKKEEGREGDETDR